MKPHVPGSTTAYEHGEHIFEGEMDLNNTHAGVCDGTTSHPAPVVGEGVEVLFEGQQKRIIELINKSTEVVGCVAWLTDFVILSALRDKAVCVIIQKEDFLRPDLKSGFSHKSKLRDYYESLSGISRHSLKESFSIAAGGECEPAILCAGLYNKHKKPAWPRMHHKFMLFRFRRDTPEPATEEDYLDDLHGRPPTLGPFDAVFTGSYNFTHNASNSLENSLIITQQPIVDAYYREFEHIFGISEPLDWNSEWVNPRYRVGT